MSDKRYQRQTTAVFHEDANEAYLLDQKGDEVITLNETGAFVWSLLKKPLTEQEIVDLMTKRYAGDRGGMEKDVRRLLKLLQDKGFVKSR